MTQQTLRKEMAKLIRKITCDVEESVYVTDEVVDLFIEWVESKRNKYDKNQETAEFRGGYENALDELIAQLKE